MEIGNIIPHIEALIFASDKPLTSMEITELINNAFGFMEEKLTLEQIQTSIDGIREKYASEFYPFEVRESGGGWQFLTKKDYHKTVAQLNGEKFLKRLSTAALETLAIIAYKQPITKGEIEAIRGVSSDYSIQKLLEKELIVISGRNEEMPGKPLVYSTSKTFMDYFGINSPADLPKLKEVFADTLVEPTIINHTPGELLPAEEGATEAAEEEKAQLVVGENGELMVHEEGVSEQVEDELTGQEEGESTEEEGDAEVADLESEEPETNESEEEEKSEDDDTTDDHKDPKTGTDKEDDEHV
ncbi:MAG: SMC-Scp complex subunit ScpB [Chitinophagaceae bacterium]|nr:SMC-Scp complex subunit ScpB [Chitinophagaceae bacterium]